ncbi:MAG: hypothetical protein HGA47_07570 [Zoogloea sp.]|nr:hypothetical protein [Zoogloea sp.]
MSKTPAMGNLHAIFQRDDSKGTFSTARNSLEEGRAACGFGLVELHLNGAEGQKCTPLRGMQYEYTDQENGFIFRLIY